MLEQAQSTGWGSAGPGVWQGSRGPGSHPRGTAQHRSGVSTLPARAWGCPWLPTPREMTSPAGKSLRQSPCASNPGAGSPAQVRRRARHAQAGPAPEAADRAALSQEHCRGGRMPTLRAAPCPTATASDVPRSPTTTVPTVTRWVTAERCRSPSPAAALISRPGCRTPQPPAMPCQRPRILLHTSQWQLRSQGPAMQGRSSCHQTPVLTWGEALVPGEVTCSAALRLGFYSLQIETEPRRALLKPLTQHMAGRRDRAEQRRRCREADEPGRRGSRSPGPPGTGSEPQPHSSRAGTSPQVSAGTSAMCPAPAWAWAGTMPPQVLAMLLLPRTSAGGAGRFSHLHFWEVGEKMHLHLWQRLLSLLGQSSSP